MTVEWGDLAWFVVPVLLQATEHAAATAHLVAQQAATIATTQSVIQSPKYVPFTFRAPVISQIMYFVASAIARPVKFVINTAKTLTLRVFGSGQ